MHYRELIQCFSNNNQNSFYNTQHDHMYLKGHLQLQFLTQPFIDDIRTLLTSLGSQKLMTYSSTSEVVFFFFFLQVSQDSLTIKCKSAEPKNLIVHNLWSSWQNMSRDWDK